MLMKTRKLRPKWRPRGWEAGMERIFIIKMGCEKVTVKITAAVKIEMLTARMFF